MTTTKPQQGSGGVAEELTPQARLIATIGAVLALALASIDISIVSTAMPSIAVNLHGLSLYSWVGTGYAVASAVMVPIAGKLGDMFGRKPFLLLGIAGLLVLSLLCGMSSTMGELVAARAVQGVFAGILMANIFTLAADIYTAENRTKVQGIFFSVAGLSMVVGPPIGGFITDHWSWRWVFYVAVPIGLLSLIAVWTSVPRVAATAGRRDIDYAGAAALLIGLVPILIALSLVGENHPWASAGVLLPLVIGVVALVAFYFIEAHAKSPIVPFRLFRSNQFSIMAVVAFVSAFGMMGTVFYVPLLYQGVLGKSAAFSGSLVIPLTAALMIVPPFASKALLTVKRYRFLAVAAFALMSVGLFLLIRTNVGSSSVLPLVAMILIGIGIGISFPMATSVTQSSVEMKDLGVATSQIQFWRMIAGPVCLAILGSLISSRVGNDQLSKTTGGSAVGASPALAHALHVAFTASLIVALVGVLTSFALREVPIIDMKAMMKQKMAGGGGSPQSQPAGANGAQPASAGANGAQPASAGSNGSRPGSDGVQPAASAARNADLARDSKSSPARG